MGDSTRLRTLLVGIDGASLNVLEPLFDAGAVPTIQRLFESGPSGTLESQIPPWTASAWPSVYTGVNPGKHGVFDFLRFDGYDWRIVDATDVHELTLWELVDRHGLTSVVVNGPVTHPAPEIDGAVIPGYVAPEEPTCHPDGILEEVREAIGGYEVYGGETDEPPAEKMAAMTDLVRARGAGFRYLADEYDPHFGFVQFQSTDTVVHEFPGDRDRLRTIYEAVDRQLAGVLDACDPDTVVVVSDHGMGPYEGRFRINDYLREHGYVTAQRGGDGMPTWAKLRNGHRPADRSVLDRAVELAAGIGITSQRIGAVLDRLGLRDVAMEVVPDNAIRAGSEQVDFPNSKAYMRSHVETGVRINLEGREPNGVVPPEEYEAVRNDVIEVLKAARSPDGVPIFQEVGPREEYFEGPYVSEAVDIVTVPNEFRFYLMTWLLGDEYEVPDDDAWDHTLEGVVAVTGEGIDSGELTGAHLFDVAPTVLATLGLPASDRMDGSTLPVVDDVGVERYPEKPDATEPVERAGDAVEEQLSNLGYIQ